jgi:tetratricopeptide (TPR) repeat protein
MVNARNSSWLRAALVASAVLIALLLTGPAVAQDAEATTELSRSQLEYNNIGVELINKGEYDEALGYFQSALALGEANVTYVNIGRTYTRMKRCAAAAAAFRKAERAPAVGSPTPDEVADILSRYRADLDEICSARLRFRCPDTPVEVRIDQAPATACPVDPVPVTPGEHRIEVTYQAQVSRDSITAVAGEVVEHVVDVPVEPALSTPAGDAGGNGLRTAAWVTSLTGGALLASGLVLDQTVVGSAYEDVEAAASGDDRAAYDEAVDDYDGVRDLNRAVFIAGGAIAASSVVFWILSSENESSTTALVAPQQGGASVQLSWRW